MTLSALSVGSLTLNPTFDPSVTSYTAELEQAGNVKETFNITAGTSAGQTVTYSIGEASSADIPAEIETVGANKALSIGNGGLTEGDTGTVILEATVSSTGTSNTNKYSIAISVTITADQIVDVETT